MHANPTDTVAYGYCYCGCGQPTPLATRTCSRDGLIRGEPLRYLRGHHRRSPGADYEVAPVSGCWIWQRYVAPHGYGVMRTDGQRVYAHRAYYERLLGPIPEGLVIDHLCRNRACVNPLHMEAVESGTNILRGVSGAAANAQKTHCIHGHPLAGANLYVATRRDGRVKRDCRICRATASARRRRRAAPSEEER